MALGSSTGFRELNCNLTIATNVISMKHYPVIMPHKYWGDVILRNWRYDQMQIWRSGFGART